MEGSEQRDPIVGKVQDEVLGLRDRDHMEVRKIVVAIAAKAVGEPFEMLDGAIHHPHPPGLSLEEMATLARVRKLLALQPAVYGRESFGILPFITLATGAPDTNSVLSRFLGFRRVGTGDDSTIQFVPQMTISETGRVMNRSGFSVQRTALDGLFAAARIRSLMADPKPVRTPRVTRRRKV